MKTSNNTISGYKVNWTMVILQKKVTRKVEKAMKKIDYFFTGYGKTEFEFHHADISKKDKVAATLKALGVSFKMVTITDKQFGLRDGILPNRQSFLAVATKKQIAELR